MIDTKKLDAIMLEMHGPMLSSDRAGNHVKNYAEPMADNHVGHQHVELGADNHVKFP